MNSSSEGALLPMSVKSREGVPAMSWRRGAERGAAQHDKPECSRSAASLPLRSVAFNADLPRRARPLRPRAE